jgi:hypothetical protein
MPWLAGFLPAVSNAVVWILILHRPQGQATSSQQIDDRQEYGKTLTDGMSHGGVPNRSYSCLNLVSQVDDVPATKWFQVVNDVAQGWIGRVLQHQGQGTVSPQAYQYQQHPEETAVTDSFSDIFG